MGIYAIYFLSLYDVFLLFVVIYSRYCVAHSYCLFVTLFTMETGILVLSSHNVTYE